MNSQHKQLQVGLIDHLLIMASKPIQALIQLGFQALFSNITIFIFQQPKIQ